jgi:hypothetical protein
MSQREKTWAEEICPDDAGSLTVCMRTFGFGGFPPIRQKKVEWMGHGRFFFNRSET